MDEKKVITIYMTITERELEHIEEYLKTIGLKDGIHYESEWE